MHIGSTFGREGPTCLRSHGRESRWRIRGGEEDDFTEVWNEPRVLQAEVLCCKGRSRANIPGVSIEDGGVETEMDEEMRVSGGNKIFNEHGAVVGSTAILSEHVGSEENLLRELRAGELADEYIEARKSSYGARGSTVTGREVTSNPGENTYHRYAGSNPESSERTRRPNGEVRGRS